MDLTSFSGINGMNLDVARMQQTTGEGIEARIKAAQQAGPSTEKEKKLMSACQEFESFFTYMLMKEMRKTVPETPLFHGGRAEEIFRDMMDEETTKQMAKTPDQGIGIAKVMYDQLSRTMIAERLQSEENTSGPENAL